MRKVERKPLSMRGPTSASGASISEERSETPSMTPASHLIFANVQSMGELVAIDPTSDRIVGRHALKGGDGPHGLLIDAPKMLAFAACEGDSKLLVVDMETFDVKQVLSTGQGPDVLALDFGLERLYVATESGIISIFQLH